MRPDPLHPDLDEAAPMLLALAGAVRAFAALLRCVVGVTTADDRLDPIVLEPRVLQPS